LIRALSCLIQPHQTSFSGRAQEKKNSATIAQDLASQVEMTHSSEVLKHGIIKTETALTLNKEKKVCRKELLHVTTAKAIHLIL